MTGIDPHIVEHEIKIYPNAKLVRQHLHTMNPLKAPPIKAKIEKLLKVGFIYLVHLNEWASNPISVDKKQETIRVCTGFRDLNKSCLKDNFPTLFIDRILDECARSQVFSFMNGFLGYNKIQINPKDQHKNSFIFP